MSTMTESKRVRVRMQTVVAGRAYNETRPRPIADYVKAGLLAVALVVDAGCWWGVCRLVRMWARLGDS